MNQGSFIGATSSDGALTLSRKGKVDLGGSTKVESGRDARLFASAANSDDPANLRLIMYANARNASLIPAKTASKLNDSFSEARSITVGPNATVGSLRHADIRANTGMQYIVESSRQYEIWGSGESGDRRITSKALGENEVATKSDNSVDVQGRVTAGLHNELDIDITGNYVLKKISDEAYEMERIRDLQLGLETD